MTNENNSVMFDEIYEAEVRGAMLVLASFMLDDEGGRALAEELVQKARNARKYGVESVESREAQLSLPFESAV